ncbi:M64 family metallopeptidase [Patescibacteria group bacterium]|nr:M64 family metallopeptidase [Patescibacteria group bacterium]
MQYLIQSIRYVIYAVILIAITLTSNINTVSAANVEVTSPDNEFYVVAKYDFEANNPENFDTPYYWWAVYDTRTHQFLEKYFQKDFSDEEALNNSRLEDVVFLKGDQEYLVGAVYCYEPLENPLALQDLPPGCSFAIKQTDVREFKLFGTIRGVAPPEQNPLQDDWAYPVSWEILSLGSSPPSDKGLLYTWGVYSYDLNEIIEIKGNTTQYQYYKAKLGLGSYIVGSFVCNKSIETDPNNPFQGFDSENCIILTRPFEIVEYIHAEPIFFEEGRVEDILIKGSITKTDSTELNYPEFNRIKATIVRHEGYRTVEEIGEIYLFDDGQHGDNGANDEIYGNYFNIENLLRSGYWIGNFELYFNDEMVYDYLTATNPGSSFYIHASPDEYITLIENGSVEDKLDVLFIGDSMETVGDVLRIIYLQEKYFIGEYGIEPFKSNKDKINWHLSTYLLYDSCDGTYQSCKFDPSNYLHAPYDKVIYFVDGPSGNYATLGGTWAVVAVGHSADDDVHARQTGTTAHEFGHSFGSLQDEYIRGDNFKALPPNCANTIDEAMQLWGDKVGQGKGVTQVLSAHELELINADTITYEEFIEKYGGYPDGQEEYEKCQLNLDECISKEDFLEIFINGCQYTEGNIRPALLSIMKSSRASINDLITRGGVFEDYYWWQNWFAPVNKAHLQGLLDNYR